MTESINQPHVKARKTADLNFSPIWILPILALAITIWLIVRVTLDSKIPITIEMSTAEGIVVGKTQLKFRGIRAGVVSNIELTDDLTRVIIHADVDPSIESYLTTQTQFWVVRAQISLAGVSGLETVLGGDYIAFEPEDTGESTRHFIVLKSAPPVGEDDPGVRVTLKADKLGSVSAGTQLFYRQIPIGEVRYFKLSQDSKNVEINAIIDEQYANLVNESTVFWNSGGIQMKGSLSGFEIHTESLSAILAGGISLFTPDMDAKKLTDDIVYDLFEDYNSAGVGVPIEIHFASGYDLQSGITKVKFQGIEIGHLDSIRIATVDGRDVVATVIIDPGAEALLNTETEFWLVKPDLSLSSLSNLETLISGNYITLKVGAATDIAREYYALDGPPPPDFSEPGLHVFLKAKELGSITMGTAILFKGVEVGRIADLLIDDLSKGIGLHLQIKPEFSHLVNSSSRFWNISGIKLSAGLGGIKVQSESMLTVVKGGIAFDTPFKDATEIEDGYEFYLLDSQDGSASHMTLTLRMKTADYLDAGFTKLKYKGFEAGVLRRVTYDAKAQEVVAEIGIDPRYQEILRENSIFWLVKPQLKASKITGLDSLLGGAYFAVQSGEGKTQSDFVLAVTAPALSWSTEGLHLSLTADTASSVQVASGVYYQDIEVGSVQSVQLNKSGTGVDVQIHIVPQFVDRVKAHSRFYNVSGISVNASASGLKISTSSIDSILSGGIAFYNDELIKQSVSIENGESYKLYDSKESAQEHGFTVVLELLDDASVDVGTLISYKGIKIGEVIKTKLIQPSHAVELTASINNEMRNLIRVNSQFWLAKTKLGLLRQENLGSLLSGPQLQLIPGDGEHQNSFKVLTQQPVITGKQTGLNLILESPTLGSISNGVPVFYRQITVGEVIGYELSATSESVLIYININERHQTLVRDNSRFWNASGIDINVGLLSGVHIKSESIESILGGGIVFATPDNVGEQVSNTHQYRLHNEVDSDWLDWSPIIQLNQ